MDASSQKANQNPSRSFILASGSPRRTTRKSGLTPPSQFLLAGMRTTGHWMASGKAWGLASSLWEALLAWGAGGGPVEATAPTASTATY